MELKVVLDKKDYDNMLKEIEDLKELIGTKVITRTDTETNYGGLGNDCQPLRFKVFEKTYKASKEVIDEINDSITKSDTAKIKELENELALCDMKIQVSEDKVKKLRKEVSELKNLSLFQRIFKQYKEHK